MGKSYRADDDYQHGCRDAKRYKKKMKKEKINRRHAREQKSDIYDPDLTDRPGRYFDEEVE